MIQPLENFMVVENRAHRAAFRDPLGQVLLEDRHMRMPHRHGRRRGARGVHHRERRNRGHLLPFPLAVVEPAYHRHHLRLRAVLQQDGPAPRVPLGDAGHGRVLHAAARVHRFLRNREHHRVGGLRHVQRAYLDTPRRHLVHVPAFGHHGVRHRLGHGDARRAAGLVVGTVRVRVRAVLAAKPQPDRAHGHAGHPHLVHVRVQRERPHRAGEGRRGQGRRRAEAPAFPRPLQGRGRGIRSVAEGNRDHDPVREGPLEHPHPGRPLPVARHGDHPPAPHLPKDGRSWQAGVPRRDRRTRIAYAPESVIATCNPHSARIRMRAE